MLATTFVPREVSRMDKSRVFIASSGRTLLLAEKLRDELQTDFCEAQLWSEEGRGHPGATIIEMLESASDRYDFAVIVLAKDDLLVRDTGDAMKARDNCVFEAGLFMAALGRKRCFLVNSVRQADLPSDLGGIISIPFEEPASLTDRIACATSVAHVAAQLKDIVQREGSVGLHASVPLLSVDELFELERPRSEGGDLDDGQVIVCDTQPWADVERAVRVRHNVDSGTSYHYFLYFSEDTIEKVCQSLHVMAWAGVAGDEKTADFHARTAAIEKERARVLDDLWDICRSGRLRVTFGMDEPILSFRVHNASNPVLARFYARYYEQGFVRWAEGQSAASLWLALPKYLADDEGDRLILPAKYVDLDHAQKQQLERSLDRMLPRYFPGLEREVRRICLGGES